MFIIIIFTSPLQCKSCLYVLCYCLGAAKRREEIKVCLTTVKQVFFSFTNGGILSLLALHPSETSSLKTITSPPSCQLLDNRLHMSPDSHIKIIMQKGLVMQCFVNRLHL